MNSKRVQARSGRSLMEHDLIGVSDVPAPSDAVQLPAMVNAQMAQADTDDVECHPEVWYG